MADTSEVDLYRDTPVRYLGYANEVGEAFRAVVHANVVRASYAVSGTYVLADATSKARAESQLSDGRPVLTFVDSLIWQGLASVAIPGFTINRLCWGVGRLLKGYSHLFSSRTRSVMIIGSGLLAIPIIIKPIDHGVDVLMDKVVRPIENIKYFSDTDFKKVKKC